MRVKLINEKLTYKSLRKLTLSDLKNAYHIYVCSKDETPDSKYINHSRFTKSVLSDKTKWGYQGKPLNGDRYTFSVAYTDKELLDKINSTGMTIVGVEYSTNESVSINEASRGHYIVPRTNAKDLPEAVYQKLIFDYDMQINCQNEEFPMPWDADFSIKGTDFILTGHAGPSGFGTCTTTIPLKNATRMIEFEVYNGLVDKDGYPDQDLIDQLNALGWDYK